MAAASKDFIPSPGARVEIRDEEWLVQKVDTTSSGGYSIHTVGMSELVRDKEAVFLTELEGKIKILDPADTELIRDDSAGHRRSRLYVESLLRQTPPTDPPSEEKLYIGHQAAMDMVPYQLDPALLAMQQPRQRILIADAVGLGKTLEAGVLLSELIRRGRAKRILVLAVKSMLTQFQKEFWARFAIPLVRLDSVGIQRAKRDIPANHNPFYYFNRAIISIDTLKQDAEYRPYIENCYWDVIIIDEAHNVAERGNSSLRARLAKLLASRSDALIMLSATPHDGSARSFASLMTMLNPTAIANPEDYTPEEIKGLFIRRFKKDIQHQVSSAFQQRQMSKRRAQASPPEEAAYDYFTDISFSRLDQRNTGHRLFKTTLEKALFSSPAACIDTARNRIARLSDVENTTGTTEDIAVLEGLIDRLDLIGPDSFTKYQALLTLIRDKKTGFGWKANRPDDRLVIFTERIETLRFLQAHLKTDLKLRDPQIEVLYGGLSDIEQQRIVEDFGKHDAKVRVLIASDIASEGINLHYSSHRLIHFDIPWSLMVFQQRNGRVDRYGQEERPEIVYMLTDSANPKIRGDMRILEILIRKDQQAHMNIGDPSAFMQVYDMDKEEAITAKAIETGTDADNFDAELDANIDDDPLAILLGDDDDIPVGDSVESAIATLPSIFPSDYHYAKDALDSIKTVRSLQVSFDDQDKFINLSVPQTIKSRIYDFPAEIADAIRETGEFVLTTDRQRIMHEIAECRKEERAWPRFHLLWDLHPIMSWLNDTIACSSFRRHQAPVIHTTVGQLQGDDVLFLLSGLIPNRKGHPLIHRWFGVHFVGDKRDVIYLDEVIDLTGLDKPSIPNLEVEPDLARLRTLLPTAVRDAYEWMSVNRSEFNGIIRPKLDFHIAELEQLRARRLEQLELDFKLPAQRQRKDQETRSVQQDFDEYQGWIRETMTTEDRPYIRVVAVFTGWKGTADER